MVLVAAVGDTSGPSPPLADRTYVVDFDSSLGTLTSWKEYTSRTFRPELFADGTFETRLQSMFRVISAPHLVDQFASDRSHMIGEVVEGIVEYKMPPPPYEPIVGPGAKARGVANNLMSEYVCMTDSGAQNSVVLRMDALLEQSWVIRHDVL